MGGPGKRLFHVIPGVSKNRLAGIRATLGHPEPFTLNYVEVGNEVRISLNEFEDRH